MTDRSRRDAWLIASGALLLSIGLIVFSNTSPARTGDTIPISITIVPSDSHGLDCSSDVHFGTARCKFDAGGKPQSAQSPLRPYMTIRREIFILAGVFEDASVVQWIKNPQRKGSSDRVRIDCQATLLGTLTSIAVRWKRTDPWGENRDVPVARVGHCRVVR